MKLTFLLIFGQILQLRCITVKDKEILNGILTSNRYDPEIRPPNENASFNQPTVVSFRAYIAFISPLDEQNSKYNVRLVLRQQWTDHRLKFNDSNYHIISFAKPKVNQIWEPKLLFSNNLDGNVINQGSSYKIYSDGSVRYVKRLLLTLSCPFDLTYYPFDEQTCDIRIATFDQTSDEIIFEWAEYDPVYVNRDLYLGKFTLQNYSAGHCTGVTGIAQYSCLKVTLRFKRDFFFQLTQTYIPTFMMILISWLSFWFSPSSIQIRMLLGLSTLSVLAIQTSLINSSIPQLSFIKLIDIWTSVCLIFVFGAFLESLIVHYIYCKNLIKSKEEDLMQDALNDDNNEKNVLINRSDRLGKQKKSNSLCCCSFLDKAISIDVICRVTFPVLFLLFIIGYSLAHIISKQDY